MVLIFAEQRHRHRNRLVGTAGGKKERVGGMERVTWKHTLPYVK